MPSLPPALRPVIEFVKKQPIVKNVIIKYDRIIVEYTTGLKESWVLRHEKTWPRKIKLPPRNWLQQQDIPTSSLYESNIFDESWNQFIAPHFIIEKNKIKKTGFINLRLKIQLLIEMILKEGWIDIKHPDEAIIADFNNLNSLIVNYNRKYSSKFITSVVLYKPLQPGHLALYAANENLPDLLPFSGNGLSLRQAWGDKSRLYKAISILIKNRYAISRDSLIRTMTLHSIAGRRMANPSFYALIMYRFLGLRNPKVLDLNPQFGSKAIATKAIGGEYYYIGEHKFADKIGKYIGEIHKDDGIQQFDVIFLNYQYNKFNLNWEQHIDKYHNRGKMLIAFVVNNLIDKLSKKPSKIFKCKTTKHRTDYLVIYNS